MSEIKNESLNLFDTSKASFRQAYMRLARTKNIGSRTFMDLINLFGDPQTAIDNLPEMMRRSGSRNQIIIPSKNQIEREIEETYKFNAEIILLCDDNYSKLLQEINDPPPMLIVKGNIKLMQSDNIVGIVGARNASANGCSITKTLANDMNKYGYVVVSGLARGIDSSAHAACINNKLNVGTIGVIAGGIDSIYPKENGWLYELMYEKGLVITEYAIGQSPMAKYFPQRNRIIAGISSGVIVIEAAIKSGTLITARLALEYGREVFAIPGSPMDPRCHGTNGLIKDGAILIESAEDVVKEFKSAMKYNKIDKDNGNYESEYDAVNPNNFKNKKFGIKNKKFNKSLYNSSNMSDSSKGEFNEYMLDILPDEQELKKCRTILLSKLSFSSTKLEVIVDSEPFIPERILSYLLIEMEINGFIEREMDDSIRIVSR